MGSEEQEKGKRREGRPTGRGRGGGWQEKRKVGEEMEEVEEVEVGFSEMWDPTRPGMDEMD